MMVAEWEIGHSPPLSPFALVINHATESFQARFLSVSWLREPVKPENAPPGWVADSAATTNAATT